MKILNKLGVRIPYRFHSKTEWGDGLAGGGALCTIGKDGDKGLFIGPMRHVEERDGAASHTRPVNTAHIIKIWFTKIKGTTIEEDDTATLIQTP